MSPQSASRGPVERVYVAVSHALETYVPRAGEGGLGRTSDDFCLIFGIPSWLMPLRDRSGQRWQPSGKPYVVAATKVCSRLIGVCWSLSFSVDPPPLAMFPSPTGLTPVDGITMRAQTILHREILHLHGLLILATSLLRTRFAILQPSFMDYITSPHIQLQIRGLDSAIRQATQAIHNGVHYIQELFTTFGMVHALNCDTTQVDAELRGCSTFPDPRLPSFPTPLGSTTTRTMTSTRSLPTASPRPPTIRTPRRPVINRSSTAPSRSRSHPRSNSRNL